MVNGYAAAIKAKLLEQQGLGYSGFGDPAMQGAITNKLKSNLAEKDWVDVGECAAMRWAFTNQKA